jgi:hypothetical protein
MATGTGIIILAGTVAAGFFIFSLTRGLKMRDDKRPLVELLWYAGGLLPLGGVCLFWASMGDQPVVPQRIILFVAGAAIGGCALLAAGEWLRPTQAQQAQSSGGGPPVTNYGPSINTWNQSGGNNTINLGPVRLAFDQAIAEELVSKLPPGKPVRLRGVGSQNDQAVVSQYQQFLQDRGFQVVRDIIGMIAPPPDHKIMLGDPNAAQMVVIIAPSAN